MRALVTGANGFIGSHMCELLRERGHEVRGLVRKTSDLTWIRELELELVYGDLADPASLGEAVKERDWVFHTAATLRPKDPGDFVRVNYEGTRALAETCAVEGVKCLVHFSSASAAGPAKRPGTPKRESDVETPVSRYGLGKLKSEQALQELAERLHSVVLRFPAVYGPRDRDGLVMLRNLKRGIAPVMSGTFSVIHVRDAARAALLAAENRVPSGSVYFVSDGPHHDYEELGRLAREALGVRALSVRVPRWAVRAAARVSEWLSREGSIFSRDKAADLVQDCWVCSPDKAREELGFEPAYTLEKGLTETIRWYQERKWL